MAPRPVAQHTFLRGRNLLEPGEFESALTSTRPSWDHGIQIGPFRVPSDDATKHLALVGAPGSGKTVLMRLLMQSVLPQIGNSWKGAISEEQARASLASSVASLLPDSIEPEQAVETKVADSSSVEHLCEELLAKFGGNVKQLLETVNQKAIELIWASGCSSLLLVFFTFWLLGAWSFLGAAGVIIVIGLESRRRTRLLAPYLKKLGPSAKEILRKFAEQKLNSETKSHEDVEFSGASASTPGVYDGPLTWEKHRAIVYDAKLEVIPQLAGMDLQAPVVVLNPFDKRSVAWDLAVDITEPATAKQIASIFIPEEKKASQPFFSDAARQLLEGVMVAFILTRPGQWTLRDVLVALKSGTRLAAVLSSTPVTKDLVETYLSNERETKSIIATIATKLGPLDVVAALWDSAESKVSLKEWLNTESILVLGNDEAYRSSLDVINQVIFKRLVELLLAQPETINGRTWFFLDEVKEAGNLDALGRLMTKGRSVGASVVLGFQDVDGMYEAFGENQAKSILGQCATKIFLRLDSPETAKWAESVFGEYEAVEVKQSASLGESTSEGSSVTTGTSDSEGYSSGRSNSWSPQGQTSGSNSGKSRSYTTSESKAESSTTGQNRSLTQAADIAKRSVVLAAQFQSLPMTTIESGVNGFIAHHLGASPFQLKGFERMLGKSDPTTPRVLYRDGSEQFLKMWTPEEEGLRIPQAATLGEHPRAGSQHTAKKTPATEQTTADTGSPRRPTAREATSDENFAFTERLNRFRKSQSR